MRKTIRVLMLLTFSCFFINSSFAAVEDTQVIDKLNNTNTTELKIDFKLKKFESCEDMSNVLTDYMKKYYNNRPNYYYGRGEIMLDDMAVSEGVSMEKSVTAEAPAADAMGGGDSDYSKTNTQVAGVDESEIIKTDGKYIYYAVDSYDYSNNKANKVIYIVKNENGKMNLVKKVKLPEHFSSVELYIQQGKMIVLANGYPVRDFQKQYWGGGYDAKTYIIVFDTTDIDSLKMLKLYMAEGAYTQSRLIEDNLYLIGSKYFNYYTLYSGVKEIDDLKVNPSDIISNELDLTYTSDEDKQNLTLKGKDLPYQVTSGESVNCSEVEYLLPDDDTTKKYEFNPSFNIVSIVNLADLTKPIKNKVVFGDIREIHMSLDSLYLTSYLYTNYDFRCGPGFMCPMMWYPRGENTLVHKFDIKDDADLSYKDSAVVSGNPLSQYSMDEYNNNFRIITSSWYPERATNLFVLDSDLKQVSSLTGLAKNETFQSSRFIKDKLFLVTFEQVDPLFVIDLKDVTKPTILGELKIPGYSTYLHPYDENHLIGLGYDTKTNKWGGTQNAGVKLDLYEINYDKKCSDTNLTADEKKGCDAGTYKGIIVKQKYTNTIGTVGSYSEALNNPRMFVWNDAKKMLFLPANIYSSYDEATYRYKDFYSGLFVFNVDKDKGIKELYRTTHIDPSIFEAERKKECDTYISQINNENKCTKLLDGTTYCPERYTYVPEYCYEGASISDYVAQQSWKYSNYFIKRALYIGDNFYSISDNKIKSNNISTFADVGTVELK